MVIAMRDAQIAFEEVVIHDTRLEQLVMDYVTARCAVREPAKLYRRLHKQLKKDLGEKARGKRLRLGNFIVTGTPIEGGDIEIPAWQSVRLKVEAALL